MKKAIAQITNNQEGTILTTLILCLSESERTKSVLLIEKKRGMGLGKISFPGGKVEETDSDVMNATRRELFEETGIRAQSLICVGNLEFRFPEKSKRSWNNDCSVFVCLEFSGILRDENDETRPFWELISQINYDRFWGADKDWVPHVLAGNKVSRKIEFDCNDNVLNVEINVLEELERWVPGGSK